MEEQETMTLNELQAFSAWDAMFLSVCASALIFLHLYYMHSLKKAEKQRLLAERRCEILQRDLQNDTLTGLLSREGILARLRETKGKQQMCAVLMDLDDLSLFNDAYGRKAGDEAIHAAGEKLRTLAMKHKALAARFGGNEFLLVFQRECPMHNEEIRREIEDIFHDHTHVMPTASIGMASGTCDEYDACILDAEAAMNEAKKKGKDMIVFYDEAMGQRMDELAWIRLKLQKAMQEDGFELLYQPKVNLAAGKVCGYEALLRIRDSTLSPARFIPAAEQFGWIVQIGRTAVEMAVRQIAEWKKEGRDVHKVSVNFSPGQMRDREFVPWLKNLLEQYDVDPSLITIEITESMFMTSTGTSLKLFEELRKIGVELDLDDFGSGYANFSWLGFLPASTIKLDKSIVDSWLKNGTIASIIDMGHQLSKSIIAEGVEERWQYEKLKELGCDVIQGYYFSKPLPAGDAVSLDVSALL